MDPVCQSREIEALFPVPVAAADLCGVGDPGTLVDPEVDQAASMGDLRRKEFAAGRACARLAMEQLGASVPTGLATDGRAPRWPDGLVGSISHTKGYCAAVVGRVADTGGAQLGLDVEATGRVKPKLWRRVFVEAERDALTSIGDAGEVDVAATVIFSIKEALYKAQYPITQSWVGFEDVRVELGEHGHAVLRPDTLLPALASVAWPVEGRWIATDGRVTTAVTLRSA